MIRGRKSKMHRCTNMGLRAQNFLGHDENPSKGPGQAVQPGKAAEQYRYYQEILFRDSGKGVPPGKTPEQYCYYQEMHFRGFGQGGLPRKGSRTKSFLPENAFQRFSEALARGSPPGKAPEQGCYYQECLPEALARGSPQERLQNKILMPRKGSRARFLLPGNAFQRLWPRGSPRKGTRRKLLLPGNAFEALAGDPAQEKLQNKIVITWKCLP